MQQEACLAGRGGVRRPYSWGGSATKGQCHSEPGLEERGRVLLSIK
jgi:hypothetical protein